MPISWYVRTYHGRMHHTEGIGQTGKTKEGKSFPEKENVHETRSEHHGTEIGQESHEKEKEKAYGRSTCI